MARPQRVHYTWDDFQKMPQDGLRRELFEGELVVTSSPVTAHQYTVMQLATFLSIWSHAGAGGFVFGAPLAVKLSEDTVFQPDLMWISPGRVPEIVEDYIYGAPDLVVEVQSPSTARRDRTRKADLYARFGAREYWLFDPSDESVEIRRLEGDRFVTHASGRGDVELVSSLTEALRIVPSRFFHSFPKRSKPGSRGP